MAIIKTGFVAEALANLQNEEFLGEWRELNVKKICVYNLRSIIKNYLISLKNSAFI